jgi:hypothetical protein
MYLKNLKKPKKLDATAVTALAVIRNEYTNR